MINLIENKSAVYKVLTNCYRQYSIWPIGRENPLGWIDTAKSGEKDECLAYVNEVWLGM